MNSYRIMRIPVASRLLAITVILFPLSVQHIDFRAAFSGGLEITAYKASPAFAAFQDLTLSIGQSDSAEFEIRENADRLVAGRQSLKKWQPPVVRRLIIAKGLRLKGPETNNVMIATIDHSIRETVNRPFMVGGEARRPDMPTTPVGRRARELAMNEYQEITQPKIETELESSTGTKILVAGSGPIRARGPVDARASFSPQRGHRPTAEVLPPPQEDVGPKPIHVAQKILGHIEMSDGLAYLGPNTSLKISRVDNGRPRESGRVWVNQGQFEINVNGNSGFLVAELIEKSGNVMGRGQVSLAELNWQGSAIEDVKIELRPVSTVASVRPSSGYSYGKNLMPVAAAKVEIEGYMDPVGLNAEQVVEVSSLEPGSSFIARATAPDHWPSLVVAQSTTIQDVRVLSNALVRALIQLNLPDHEFKEAQELGIVWGRVVHEGKPVTGARVEMAGSTYVPVYLNESYLPDTKRTTTSSNGLFAFLRVRSGVQALRVHFEGRTYPAQILLAESGHVSFADLDLRNELLTDVQIVNGFQPDQKLQAVARFFGTDTELPINGVATLRYSVASDPQFVEADAGEVYDVTRITVSGLPTEMTIPMIPTQWRRSLYQSVGVYEDVAKGVVVGFVDSSDFSVGMTGYSDVEKPLIIYFDREGNRIEGDHGIIGGGFLIINSPTGVQTVFIHPLNSPRTQSHIVLTEPGYTHVLSGRDF